MSLRTFASLRARLVLLVLLVLVAFAGLGVYTYDQMRLSAGASTREVTLRLARLAAKDYKESLDSTRQLFVTLAEIPQVRQISSPACEEILASLVKQHDPYSNLFVASPSGAILCSGVAAAPSVNFAGGAWFQRAVAGRSFTVGEYAMEPATGTRALLLGYPILGSDGSVRAILIAALDLDWVSRLATTADLPDGVSLTVTDREGVIVSRYPEAQEWIGRPLPDTELLSFIREHGEGSVFGTGVDGVRRLYGFTTLGETTAPEAYVNVGVPTAVAFATARDLLTRYIIVLGVLALAAIAAVWFGGDLLVLRPIRVLHNAMNRLTRGEMESRVHVRNAPDEVLELARGFNVMADALEGRDEELRRMARELHDEIGQSLTGLNFSLEAALRSPPEDSRARLLEAQRQVSDLMVRTRELSITLRPPVLDDLGLVPALTRLFADYAEKAGITVHFKHTDMDKRFSPDTEIAAYRIVQEALTNAARHAGVSEVDVVLWREDARLLLKVEDQGQGFDVAREAGAHSGMGLAGMQERARLRGGRLVVDSAPQKGTSIFAELPVE